MASKLTIKKGLNLNLEGGIQPDAKPELKVIGRVAMTPDDFPGMTPKPEVKPGDKVVVGQPLWHDKNDEAIKVVSPVDGIVVDVVRGERRKLQQIVIDTLPGQLQSVLDKETVSPSQIRAVMQESGVWAMIRQLPFDIVPSSDSEPRDIFISAWDAAPLAYNMVELLEVVLTPYLKKGVDALKKLTKGKVYIGYKAGHEFPDIPGAEIIAVKGDFPASLPSVMAASLAPVNKGETVWLMDGMTAARIGQAVDGVQVDWTFPVAITGSELIEPKLSYVPAGSSIKELLWGDLKKSGHNIRVISGNVLTGDNVGINGYLRYPYRQVTVIPEGDDVVEFMGWASMSPSKMSNSRSFPGFFRKRKAFTPDARLNGGRRAMIMSGQYEKVIPMDIMPEHLIKAIIARDIERMEALGIYEVTPADFAAAEYVDTSKLELQKIVREGLDYMIKELGVRK